MPGWDLVIFDNDGVLVDSEALANDVLASLLSDLGVPTTVEEAVDRYLGGTIGRVRHLVEALTGTTLPADFEERYHAGVLHAFAADLRPMPGAEKMLADLDAVGQAYCVASSGTGARIRAALSITGLLDRFTGRIFSAEDVAWGKPAPDLFLMAARCLSAVPARCVVVEDSPVGVAAARAAGMTTIGFTRDTPAPDLGGADTCVADLSEVRAYLAAWTPGVAGGRPHD
ncbi:MAG: HAD family hydrolase [Acidimicrobiales bacterium]